MTREKRIYAPGEFYCDKKLGRSLEKIKKKVNEKDEDYFFAVDGEEGAGKSVLAQQLASMLDPTFCLERIVFDPKQFREAVLKAEKGQAIVFDEAFRGLSSRGALTQVNKLLVAMMMECRQKNLFVFIVMPTFFLLEKYVAIWRAKGLFHVYRKDGKRGFWMCFNRKKTKILYLHGKKTYSYRHPKSSFKGRFMEQYTVDEEAYRQKKRDALSEIDGEKPRNEDGAIAQRDLLLWLLVKEKGMNGLEVQRRLKDLGWRVGATTVKDGVRKAEERLRAQGLLL